MIIVAFGIGIMLYPIIHKMYNDPKIRRYEEENSYTNITNQKIFVTVAGEVKIPGIYEMSTNDRINDAIINAGGFTENAYTDNINLSQRLSDEQYIYIMDKDQGEVYEKDSMNEENKFDVIVNINTATKNELCKLPGIGEKTAEKIINYRTINGGFNKIDELMNVEGIGQSKFNKIKNNLTV